MRFREDIPLEKWAVNASDDILLFTVALATIIGSILTWPGFKGR